ncbi:MAG: metallophosphoesterase [Christensenellales bacterium]|jgi:predicted phosphohydrolase
MNVYAIGDLHLSGFSPKPMNIFGEHWVDHWTKIKESWYHLVSDNDIVLIPGDLSWALRLSEAESDIADICALPGKKVLLKGNHDYWWNSLSQVNSLLSNETYALQNNSVCFDEYVIAGSRGWTTPGTNQYNPDQDEKLYIREAGRLEFSLQHAKKSAPDARLIGMMHFPPSDMRGAKTLYTDLFESYGATHVVYAHLHSSSINYALSGKVRGVEYSLVSCDATNFKLAKII